MVTIFIFNLYQYKPMFNYEIDNNSFLQDLNFINLCYKDSKENSTNEINNAQINFDLADNHEPVYNEIESSGYFKFYNKEDNVKIIFSKLDFYNIKQGISEGKDSYNIEYYSHSHIMKNIEIAGEYSENERTAELLNELLDMDIEITLTVNKKETTVNKYGTIFINRPLIPYYDDKEIGGPPPNRSISLYIEKDGEFYKTCDFSEKVWLNDLTLLNERHKCGDYELTLVYGYDENTGEYTPVSNTILYTIDKSGIPNTDYTSISLDGTSS
jgi:hypothetical protein